MKTEVRIGSVGPGVGNSQAALLDFIYMYLLHEFGQDFYRRIGINRVGNDINEFVMQEPGNKVHVNIRYPIPEDFESRTPEQKNLIGLDIVHSALLRIASYNGKLDVGKIEQIKNKILKQNFSFEFIYREHKNRRIPDSLAKILGHPSNDKFVYSASIEEGGIERCRKVIFNGIPGYYYADKYFYYGRWKGSDEFVIWGREHTVETHILVKKCLINIVNLTPYENPPYYTLMKAALSEEERRMARKDWEHSLPPAIAAVIRDPRN